MRVAVITVVHGRCGHLRRQLEGISHSNRPADLHVVVAVNDPGVHDVVAGSPAQVLDLEFSGTALPVARARNLGAESALRGGAELLVFLDVDCIPGRDLIDRYHLAAGSAEHTGSLLCGPVTYLPPPGPSGYALCELPDLVDPHPARPAPSDRTVVTGADYTLFWSLSFAVTAPTWRRIGGFCERYLGYGGEDTDFGQSAAVAGVPLRWVGGADAFHQFHPVSNPPVEHLDDILRNARIFHDRWGWWPMSGWLDEFEDAGLIRRDAQGCPSRRI